MSKHRQSFENNTYLGIRYFMLGCIHIAFTIAEFLFSVLLLLLHIYDLLLFPHTRIVRYNG